MPPKRDNTLFRPPEEILSLFSEDDDSSDEEETQTLSPRTTRAASLDPVSANRPTGRDKKSAVPTEISIVEEEEEGPDFFSEYVEAKPTKPAPTSRKPQNKASSSLPPRRSARQATPVQSQPAAPTSLRRSTRASSQPASDRPSDVTSSAPVPSAPQTVSKKRKAAGPPKTGSKSIPKAKKARVQPKKGRTAATPAVSEKDAEGDFDDDLAGDVEEVHSTRPTRGGKSLAAKTTKTRSQPKRGRSATPAIPESAPEEKPDDDSDESVNGHPTTGGKSLHPTQGGKGIPTAPLATIHEVDTEHSNTGSSIASQSEEAIIETIENDTKQRYKLEAKAGTEDTYWVYVVVQDDNRAQGIPGRTILGTYIDKRKATERMLKRIQRLQKETGGDQFELRSAFGPEGLYKQVVDSQGFGAVAVFIEKELREGVAPQDRVQPTNNWLPRFVYVTIVQTEDLETGVVKTHVHEKVYTTLEQANRHAIDVWRLGQMTTEEIQIRNLHAGTMIGGDHEGWVIKRLDKLERDQLPFAETWQLPLGEGPKTEEVSIRVHRHEVAGPRN